MTDRVEAALRAQPPDEPEYRGDIAGFLVEADAAAAAPPMRSTPVDLTSDDPRSPTRRRVMVASIVAAAACAAAIALVSTIREPSSPPAVSTPTTTAPGPSLDVSLSALDGRWVGRATTTDASSPAPVFLVFGDGSVVMQQSVGGIINSFASDLEELPDGGLRATLTDQIGRCAPASAGDFTWGLSPGGSTLAIAVVDDECAPRGEAFTGTWTRVGCPTRGSDCLGPLEAGRYESVSFDPFGTAAYGQVSYAVPAGWSSPLDDRARLALEPDGSSTTARRGVYFFADAAAPDDSCSTAADDGSGADAIAAGLASSLASVGASATTTDTSVGGLPAQVVDITTGATSPCGSGPVALLVARADSPIAWTVTGDASNRTRIVLVDLPGGRTMAIVVASDSSDSDEALLDAASDVIDSLVLSSAP